MSEIALGVAVVVALCSAGFLLVRYEILTTRDTVAGALLVGALAYIWRALSRRPVDEQRREVDLGGGELDLEPPTREVDAIIRESEERASGKPSNGIHEELRSRLRDLD